MNWPVLLSTLLLGAALSRTEGPLLAPWGNQSGAELRLDVTRGPWARRWTAEDKAGRTMLTIYRSADDARRVALFSRGLGDGPGTDDDAAFLQGALPVAWRSDYRAVRQVTYSETAHGLCAIVEPWDQNRPLRLCMASRPDSAAVATAMSTLDRDTAAEAALLLARYAARHPMRIAG